MATLVELANAGFLHKYDPELAANLQEDRMLYASERLRDYLHDTLPRLGSSWNIETSPLEQFDALMEVYTSGDVLTYGHTLNPLRHVADGVWELKTADLRIFGWFPVMDVFVGVVADLAQRVKEHHLYNGYAGDVVRFRDALDLDEPKFIAGTDPRYVVSNFSYP